jgi:hypothetical protein
MSGYAVCNTDYSIPDGVCPDKVRPILLADMKHAQVGVQFGNHISIECVLQCSASFF